MAKLKELIAWVKHLRPVRVYTHYSENRGPLLSAGLSFRAIFAVFAALWVLFSVAGLFLQSNPQLADAFFNIINTSVPGLIEYDGAEGIIDPSDLLTETSFNLSGIIAFIGLAFTALSWLASCRNAVRTLFGLPDEIINVVLLRLKDVGLAIGFGILLLISAALLVFSTDTLGFVLDLIGIDGDSWLANALGQGLSIALMFILDAFTLGALFRALSGLKIPFRRLIVGVLLGAAGMGVIKILGTALLGGASKNPLIASFAVILGLLIWFNLLCQIILLTASWIAVGMADAGMIADPKIEAKREEEERLAAQRLAERRQAEEEARRRKSWWWRLFHWGRRPAPVEIPPVEPEPPQFPWGHHDDDAEDAEKQDAEKKDAEGAGRERP